MLPNELAMIEVRELGPVKVKSHGVSSMDACSEIPRQRSVLQVSYSVSVGICIVIGIV